MPQQPPRDVEETEQFKRRREEIFPDTKLFDDVTRGVVFSVAKKPDIFPTVPDSDIKAVKIRATNATPALTIFFRKKDAHTIEFLDLITSC